MSNTLSLPEQQDKQVTALNKPRKPRASGPMNSPGPANALFQIWISQQTPLDIHLVTGNNITGTLIEASRYALRFIESETAEEILAFKHGLVTIKPLSDGGK